MFACTGAYVFFIQIHVVLHKTISKHLYDVGFFYFQSRVDLEFLWMLLERLGVSTPSLDSILSFQIDGLENMLPVKKALIASEL
jgi:hypothetical protein